MLGSRSSVQGAAGLEVAASTVIYLNQGDLSKGTGRAIPYPVYELP